MIAPYTATSTEQLSLQRGQLVKIRKKTTTGWWEGELQVNKNSLSLSIKEIELIVKTMLGKRSKTSNWLVPSVLCKTTRCCW